LGAPGRDEAFAVAVDPTSGDPIIVGEVEGVGTFDGNIVGQTGTGRDIVVAKLDAATGTVKWAQTFVSSGAKDDGARGVAIDANGNAYVTGYFHDTMTIAGMSHDAASGNYGLLVKLSPFGMPLWFLQFGGNSASEGGPGTERGTAITVDSNGDVVLTGWLSQNVADMFVSKYSSGGALLWTVVPTGTGGGEVPTSVATDPSGNIFVSGLFQSNAVTFPNDASITRSGNEDAFLAKLGSDGGVLLAEAYGQDGGFYNGFVSSRRRNTLFAANAHLRPIGPLRAFTPPGGVIVGGFGPIP
jgi:hypothetical protein